MNDVEEVKDEREYCEFEKIGIIGGNRCFHTQCGKYFCSSIITDYGSYCTFCGKKIKLIKKK